MNKEQLISLLEDARLHALLGTYGSAEGSTQAGQSRNDRLGSQVKQLRASRFVVPIAGIQGSGKSTLLNALAFDKPVLPVDADETTCVPVEIGWSANPVPRATVHYTDGRTTTLACTEDALRSVVHNESNRGNVQGVARVVLESSRELFRHGLVLVDLPGTGSLTAANMETTQRYLREAVGVIFMLRTVPPLTRSEAMFVQLQWASLRSAIFVQNRWNDETDDEALAGRDHNVTVLQSIAQKARIPLVQPPAVHVVNGYQGQLASFTNDDKLATASGLAGLRSVLADFGRDWGQRVGTNVVDSLNADLGHVKDVIKRRLEGSSLDHQQHAERMAKEQRQFNERLARLDELNTTLTDDAQQFRRQVRKDVRAWASDKGAELRNVMREKMRKGIVDGPRLERALRDEQSEASEDIFARVQEDALVLQDKLRVHLENLDAWGGQAPDARFTVDKPEATKLESLASRAGGAGGAIAGAKYGGMLGSAGGPVGTAIGMAIGGLIGGLAGAWLGGKTRQGVTEMRMRAVEPEVWAAIDNFLRSTSDTLTTTVDQFYGEVEAQLEQWRNSEISRFETQRRQVQEQLNQTAQQKEQALQALEEDSHKLEQIQAALKEATK